MEGGATIRQHLEQVVRSSGGKIVPPELDIPDMPPELEHLWLWFVDLSRARPSTGFGPGALPYSEIMAWVALSGERPSSWEISVLKRLDGVYLEATAKPGTPSGSKNARGPRDPGIRR